MIGRKTSAVVLAALGIAAAATISSGAPNAETALPAVRYPAYPVAKKIEPIVPPRTAQSAVRKGVTTASVPKKIAAPQKPAAKAAAAKSAPPGKSALGGPVPTVKAVKPAKPKQASAKR